MTPKNNLTRNGSRAVSPVSEGVRPQQPASPVPTRIEDVYGMLHRPGMKTLSIEEMDEAIAAAVRRRHARGEY